MYMENEKKVPVSARVSEAQVNELDQIASDNNMSRSDVIEAKLSGNFEKIKNQKYRNYLNQVSDICTNLTKIGESWVLEMDTKEDTIRQDFVAEIDELKQSLEASNAENDTLKAQNKELQESYEKFKKDTEAQSQTIAANDKSIALLESTVDDLKAMNASNRTQIDSQTAQIKDLQSNVDSLKDEVVAKKEELAVKIKECEMLQSEHSKTADEIALLRKENDDLKKVDTDLMIVKNENDGLKTRLAEARKAVENEKKRHTDANNALINANTKLAVQQEKINNLQAQIAELKTRLEKKKRKKRRGVTSSFDFFIFDEYNEIRDGTPRGVASRNLFN